MKYNRGYKDYNPLVEKQPGPGKYDIIYAIALVVWISVMVYVVGWW